MTARLPEEPVRVTNWLAGWLDYVFATVLVAGRWLRVPAARSREQQVLMTAFAPAVGDPYAARWAEIDDETQGSSGLVKALEIVMLSVSFFLAAHLLSGGTPTVTAPNLNAFNLGGAHIEAASLPVPAATGRQVVVPAGSFASLAPAPATDAAQVEQSAVAAAEPVAEEEAAVLAPASAPAADAASLTPQAETEPAPAAVQAPAPVVPVPPAPVPVATVAPPSPDDRYLSAAELRTAALAAGWPQELLDDIETVAWCESRYHTHAEYYGARGLMQVVEIWFIDAGLNPDLWWDPVTNLRAARHAYDTQIRNGVEGWGPWTCKP